MMQWKLICGVALVTLGIAGQWLVLDSTPASPAAAEVSKPSTQPAVLTPPQPQPPVTGGSGLVAHYPLDGNLSDASGNAHHGVMSAGAAMFGVDRKGVAGGALSLDGTAHVQVNAGAGDFNFNASTSWSVSAWVRPADITAVGGILSQRKVSDGSVYYQMGLRNSRLSGESPPLNPVAIGNSGALLGGAGEWKHVMCVYDRAASGKISRYINGVLVDEMGMNAPNGVSATACDQFLLGANSVTQPGAWVARESRRRWGAAASSADGTRLAMAVWPGQIYTSTDSGVTWTPREFSRKWWSLASSADGLKLVAGVIGGQIYTSTDAGETWTARAVEFSWNSVASSADGTKLVAVAHGDKIYTSSDSGVTWVTRETNRPWNKVASSADGTKLVAGVLNGKLYTSADSGVTWIEREVDSANPVSRDWTGLASSADGTKLAVCAWPGQIYTSTDSGATWTARASVRNWNTIACSADGARLVAVVYGGQIHASTDSGVTWTASEPNRNWGTVVSSADGFNLMATVADGQIYTYSTRSTAGFGGLMDEVRVYNRAFSAAEVRELCDR